jgi:hypothetical protein
MMFGWFKRSKAPAPPLGLKVLAHASPESVANMIRDSEPAARLHTLVGLVTVSPTISAFKSVLKENGQELTKEDVVAEMADGIANARSEAERHRLHWMLMGYLILSIDDKCSDELLLEIWKNLIASVVFSKGALERNVLWSPAEKEFFLKSEPHVAAVVLIENHAPLRIRKNKDLTALAWSLVALESPLDQAGN